MMIQRSSRVARRFFLPDNRPFCFRGDLSGRPFSGPPGARRFETAVFPAPEARPFPRRPADRKRCPDAPFHRGITRPETFAPHSTVERGSRPLPMLHSTLECSTGKLLCPIPPSNSPAGDSLRLIPPSDEAAGHSLRPFPASNCPLWSFSPSFQRGIGCIFTPKVLFISQLARKCQFSPFPRPRVRIGDVQKQKTPKQKG